MNKSDSTPLPLSCEEVDRALLKSTVAFGQDLIILNDVSTLGTHHHSFQVGFLVLSICTSGEAHFSLMDNECVMRKNDLVILFGDQMFKNLSVSDDFHAPTVLMSRAYAQDCLVGLNYLWPYLIYVMSSPVVHLTDKETEWVMNCLRLLEQRVGQADKSRFLRETVVSLTRAFYFEVCSLLDKRTPVGHAGRQSRSYVIFDQFIRLVSINFKRERSVEWYSNEMCLTPKHLSEVVKTVSGKTAGQWITLFVMIEIKTLLNDSSLSIKEITLEMNFPNQSFLGKYFKNIAGMSPSDYRKMVLREEE